MEYAVYGPFDIARDSGLVDKRKITLEKFWAMVEKEQKGLSGAVGCYIFCIGKKPWYVGMAERQSFRGECFANHKVLAYAYCLHKMRGIPKLYLLPKLTNSRRWAKPTHGKHPATRFLESLLIGMALTKNAELANVKKTKFQKEMIVPGVINTPKGKAKRHSVSSLRKALGT